MKLSSRYSGYHQSRENHGYNSSYQNGSNALQQNTLQQYATLHPFDKDQALLNYQEYHNQNTSLQQEIPNNTPEVIVSRAEIDGDPYTFNGYDYTLTPENLWQAGLEPCHEFTIEGVNIGISHIFKTHGRKTAIAYIEGPDGRIHTRSYYQSNSSAQWRYLPDYVPDENGLPWFGKGYSEESLNLPSELQKELNLINERGITGTNNIDPGFLFFGTAKKYQSQQEYLISKHNKSLRGDFYQEVNYNPEYFFGKTSLDKRPPEYVDVDGFSAPNFRMPPKRSIIHSQLYGEVSVEMFPSLDGELLYSMCRVGSPPQGWIGNIETRSRITTTGCREKWVSMGDVGTPLLEYKKQADGYGDPRFFRGGYTSMWKNYLEKMPIIRRWLQIFD